ncbi:target of Myb protein 1 [Artemisia annua]|uniref:Target of Myb protein 1 n=1 Tax=Artemisia annua TaxID=35608 RepID=A0A2U1L2F8_ARTAN|nr:target of Myb protein 1 [Artemisia annua]
MGTAARVEFPPREESSVPLFTPPQTHPIVHPTDAYEEAAVHASLETDASGLGYYLNFGLVNNVYVTDAHMATPIMILNALNFDGRFPFFGDSRTIYLFYVFGLHLQPITL